MKSRENLKGTNFAFTSCESSKTTIFKVLPWRHFVILSCLLFTPISWTIWKSPWRLNLTMISFFLAQIFDSLVSWNESEIKSTKIGKIVQIRNRLKITNVDLNHKNRPKLTDIDPNQPKSAQRSKLDYKSGYPTL